MTGSANQMPLIPASGNYTAGNQGGNAPSATSPGTYVDLHGDASDNDTTEDAGQVDINGDSVGGPGDCGTSLSTMGR